MGDNHLKAWVKDIEEIRRKKEGREKLTTVCVLKGRRAGKEIPKEAKFLIERANPISRKGDQAGTL